MNAPTFDYKIVRHYSDNRKSTTLKEGVSLWYAKMHCMRPDSHGEVDGVTWCDGFMRMRSGDREDLCVTRK